MSEWEGHERRKAQRPHGNGDHDLLTRIDVNLSNFMKRFDKHEEIDDVRFDSLFKKTSGHQKFQWLLAGGFIVLNIALGIFGKYLVGALK